MSSGGELLGTESSHIEPFITDPQGSLGANQFAAIGMVTAWGQFSCTGTLISSLHVLTAAHCIYLPSYGIDLRAGGAGFIVDGPAGSYYQARNVHLGPNWDGYTINTDDADDIAIIELSQPVDSVAPVPFAKSVPSLAELIYLVGFGRTGNGIQGPADPNNARVKYWGVTYIDQLSSNLVKWRYDVGESNTAPGDSGGPQLRCDSNGTNCVIVSVTSGGTGDRYGSWSFNTRVDAYKSWIDAILAPPSKVDLSPFRVNGPTTATPGATISVFTDVDNFGTSPSGSFEFGYYLSTDSLCTTSDMLVKKVTRPSVPGQTYQQWTESMTLPTGLTSGSYHLCGIADPNNMVAESNELNNTLADSLPIAIIVPVQIDLSPFRVNGPTTATPGATISVFTDVDNFGTSPSGHFEFGYYFSTDSLCTTSDMVVKKVTRPSVPGQTYQQWTESMTLPTGLTSGSYHLCGIADPNNLIVEPNELNNALADSLPIVIRVPVQIDLSPFQVNGPTTATPGATISVFTDVDNFGTSPSGSFEFGYYLSADSLCTTSDIVVKKVTRPSVPGQTYQQWTESMTLPTGLTSGSYQLCGIADPNNMVAESNELNNTLADTVPVDIGGPIDLSPFVVRGPKKAKAGTTITVFTDVDNFGTGPSGSFEVGYYLSTDSNCTPFDTLLKRVIRPGINGQSHQQWTEAITLPAWVTPGKYSLCTMTDPNNAVAETNELNNSVVRPITILPASRTLVRTTPGAQALDVVHSAKVPTSVGTIPSVSRCAFTPVPQYSGHVDGHLNVQSTQTVATGPRNGEDSEPNLDRTGFRFSRIERNGLPARNAHSVQLIDPLLASRWPSRLVALDDHALLSL
jgi:subtilase family serine protease